MKTQALARLTEVSAIPQVELLRARISKIRQEILKLQEHSPRTGKGRIDELQKKIEVDTVKMRSLLHP